MEEEPEAAALAAKFDDGRRRDDDAADDDDDEQVQAAGRKGGRGRPPPLLLLEAAAAAADVGPAASQRRLNGPVPPLPAHMQEALRRAVEQDPSLLLQHPELQGVADRAQADALKAKGNAAFAAGRHAEAVQLFSRCIELDPSNHIYFSNRAAAHLGGKEYAAAARDAARCTELKPGWAKGWSRLGAAHFGLDQFSEVRLPAASPAWLLPWPLLSGQVGDSSLQLAAHLLCQQPDTPPPPTGGAFG